MAACVIVGVIAVALLVGLSAIADRKLRRFNSLPMQWGLDGQPTWRAPRRLALSFTPALGTVLMIAVAAKAAVTGWAFPAALAVAAALLVAHCLYVALLYRTLRP